MGRTGRVGVRLGLLLVGALLVVVLSGGMASAYTVAGWNVDVLETNTPAEGVDSPFRYPEEFGAGDSTDGGRIAFIQGGEGFYERFVVLYDPDTGVSTEITPRDAGASDVQLRGDHIAWVGRTGPDPEIFLHTISTGETLQVTDDLDPDSSPRLTDRFLVWSHGPGDAEIRAYDLGSGTTSTVWTGVGYFNQYEVGGRWVLRREWGPDGHSVHVHDLETGESKAPAALQETQVFALFSDYAVIPGNERRGLFLYNIPTETTVKLADGSPASVSVDEDSDRLAYAVWADHMAQIRIHDLASGHVQMLKMPGYTVGGLDFEGDVLLFRRSAPLSYWHGDRTVAYLLSQGTSTELVGGPRPPDVMTDGEHVYWYNVVGGGTLDPYYYYRPDENMRLHLTVATPPETPLVPFSDVPGDAPYRTAAVALAERGVIEGYPSAGGREFRPAAPFLRAQFAKVIVEALEVPVDESMSTSFSDLGPDGPGLYPHEYIAAAVRAGFATGYRSTVFAPYFAPFQTLSRAQLVTMVVRAAQAEELIPAEMRIPWQYVRPAPGNFDPVHAPNLWQAESAGLVSGLPGYGTTWDPWAPASRSEAAQLVWNLLQLKQSPPADYPPYPYR